MDDSIGRWLIFMLLACLAFLFKLLSSALIHSNESRLIQKGGKRLEALMKAPASAKLALSLLRTAALLLISVFAAYCFAHTALQALLTALILLPVSMLFLKRIPSALGERFADPLVLSLCPLISALGFLLKPLTAFTDWFTGLFLKPFGGGAKKEEVTEQDIRAMVDIGEESGSIEGTEHDMIENVFDFGDLTAGDSMTHRTDITAVSAEDSEEEIIKTIESSGLSRLPVYDKEIDDMIGILFTRDYLINVVKPAQAKKPLRALLRDPYFVPETVKADTLLRNMQRNKTHMAIVVDEYGGVSGLVTMEDLLEEIVGDIYDEFDPADEIDIKYIAPDTYRVSGSAMLDDLSDAMDVSIPENEDYDTLGGLFLSRLSEIPEDGATPEADIFLTANFEKPEEGGCELLHIKVEKLIDRRIESALIIKRHYQPQSDEIKRAEAEAKSAADQ